MKQMNLFRAFFLLAFFSLVAPNVNGADFQNDSIQWIKGLSWAEIKDKARRENKYIFIDAYATWCGPCKKMDRETFKEAGVIEILDDRFLPVKVQMDQTSKDAPDIREWYTEAQTIKKEFHVRAYPTYIYISPAGIVTHKITGFNDVKKFLKETAVALKPGQQYNDPNAAFFAMQEAFENGDRTYSQMPYLFQRAMKLRETEFAEAVSKEYRDYLQTLPEDSLYTATNIEFYTSHALSSKSFVFKLFYPDGSRVDRVMGKKGFSADIVDKVIMREITSPFLGVKASRMQLIGGKMDSREADWKALRKAIRKQYGKEIARRNVIQAKLFWYKRNNNQPQYNSAFHEALKTYGLDTVNRSGERASGPVNKFMWDLFLSEKDLQVLQWAADWMRKVVEASVNDGNHPVFMDTYANLLYKLGKRQEAIQWEEKAVQILKAQNSVLYLKDYEATLAKMKTGQPTWPLK